MATNPIDYVTAVYGNPPWTTLNLTWDGTNTDFTLYRVGVSASLITGSYMSYTFVGEPDSRYDFLVETSTPQGNRTMTIAAYTAPLPPPTGLTALNTTSTTIQLSWQAVSGATYEVADVGEAYEIVTTGSATSALVTGLSPSTRHSYAVRSVLGTSRSRWSNPVTVTTQPSSIAASGVYTYNPVSVAVWKAGRVGSSDPAWRPASDDYYHGDGWTWGDTSGVQSTYLFYGSPNPFIALAGAGITRFEIFVERTSAAGDPGQILSHWFLHSYGTKPSGEPVPNSSVYDAGLFPRGGSGWVDLPVSWAYSIITNGLHKGIGWGNTTQRYQVAPYRETQPAVRLGTLRITAA